MINIARGQITISILEKGDTGAAGKDAEFVKLQFYTQEAYVDSNEHLHINISGKIIQVTGNTIKAVDNPTKYAIQGMIKHSDIDFDITINSDGTFRYIDNDASYESQNNDPITHIEITFGENGGIIESYTIPVTLIPSATFEIKQATDTEVASIKSRITANETKIANNVKQITNNYSTLTQKADTIESRVGKMELSKQNIINDKQFFILSDKQPHQSREYDAATDTYTFKSTDKTNDIDYNSAYIKLETGKYLLAFTPTVNGSDVRMLLQVSLFSDASGSNAIDNQVIKYSDIPQHKLYTYEFTVTKDRPYLQLYLESSAQNNQTTLPWIVKLQNIRLLKINESESLIKQTVDNIELKVKNTGINIEDGQITATSNNFKVVNESGQPTFEIDNKGNLIGSGSARFQGCVSYGKTIITKENFDYYIQKGSYSGLRLDRLMPRIQIGNNEEPVGGTRTYLPQQNLSLPQMFISTVDGDAIMSGMSLGLKKSEWNEICRGFAGNFFYIYNKINPKYPANTISIYGDISGMPLSYTSYIDIKSGQFLVLKCEIGIEKKSTQECLVWKYVNLGKISI